MQETKRCPFCSIASGKISSPIVYQDEKVIATLDIRPANRGHILVFPKEHYNVLSQMPREEYLHLFEVARIMSIALLHTVTPDGVNLVTRSGKAAGQTIQHAKVHIVPRNKNDEVVVNWKGREASEDELMEVRNKIRAYLEEEERRLKQETGTRQQPKRGAKKQPQKPNKRFERKSRSKKSMKPPKEGKEEDEEDIEEFRGPMP